VTTYFFDDIIRQGEFRHSGYRINRISGAPVDLPQCFTDDYIVKSERSAERHLSRLKDFGRVLREVKVRVEDDRANGVIPPDLVIDRALTGMRAFIKGGAVSNVLMMTLPAKLERIEGLSRAESSR